MTPQESLLPRAPASPQSLLQGASKLFISLAVVFATHAGLWWLTHIGALGEHRSRSRGEFSLSGEAFLLAWLVGVPVQIVSLYFLGVRRDGSAVEAAKRVVLESVGTLWAAAWALEAAGKLMNHATGHWKVGATLCYAGAAVALQLALTRMHAAQPRRALPKWAQHVLVAACAVGAARMTLRAISSFASRVRDTRGMSHWAPVVLLTLEVAFEAISAWVIYARGDLYSAAATGGMFSWVLFVEVHWRTRPWYIRTHSTLLVVTGLVAAALAWRARHGFAFDGAEEDDDGGVAAAGGTQLPVVHKGRDLCAVEAVPLRDTQHSAKESAVELGEHALP